MSLLRLEHVSAFYGPSQALFDVSLRLDQGEVVALMGRNGMGKTTTIKVICRMLKHRGGAVMLDGQDMARWPSYRAARAGLGLVPEGRRCFPNLSVRENLIASARPGDWTLRRVFDFFPRLGERAGQMAVSLSGGEQQMLAIGRALMTNPRILILDEATEGLAPVIRNEIWAAIGQLKRDTGLSILVVDKSLKELSRVADRGVILERGRSVWGGGFDRLDAEKRDRYLGV
ncbi:ABC transporter ATP-binding protein [Aquicoccus porphyridii]|uniref:ABC transporter ATP-binding protein n=1 Tax=Aquicoccus porphyridii TaxID=1852029 RepID=A0A5A9ZUN8_9RHOB|nr:ABC transporter ATP-binding protein [Aquicoccus porphyridii]KAA0921088.1 ABC transporter ATP-binding protein [Aquicoccus porphyridii]RAI56377.1 ABC transporter ATP-binding protein [Rhodobacteraceae bacterium AsT-22]